MDERNSGKKSAIVIGSGFGGLSCAIRLQAAGIQTTVVEKRDKPGGRAYVYEDQGFKFDGGPTVITAPELLEELWADAGYRLSDDVELLPVTPFYRLFWQDGYRFDYSNEPGVIEKQITERSPGDLDGYRRFLDYSREVYAQGYTKLAHVPFLDWWSMFKASPQLIRLRADRSVYRTVARHVKDEHLREAFSFHSLLVGGNPFETSSIYTLIHFLERKGGVWFPRGGTGALVRAMVRLLERLGGKLECSAGVDRILTERGLATGVRLESGREIRADAVVSNAEVMHTYKHLLRAEDRLESRRRKLDRSRWSMSLVVIYFGTNRQYPELAHHNVIFGPRYRGLLDDIFHRGKLADDFSLYLHAPTRTDPGMAPPGCEAFYVLSPVPHLGKLDIDWSVEGPKYADRILTALERDHLPGLKQSIVTQRVFTPADFESTLSSHLGSAFSLEPVLTQSAFFRVHNRDEAIPNLYFAGAGTHPGAGVPGVVNSAKATAKLMIDDFACSSRGGA